MANISDVKVDRSDDGGALWTLKCDGAPISLALIPPTKQSAQHGEWEVEVTVADRAFGQRGVDRREAFKRASADAHKAVQGVDWDAIAVELERQGAFA